MALAMSGPASRTRSAPSPACFHSPASSCRSRRIFVVPFPEGVERVTRYRSLPTANSSVTAIRGWPWLTSWLTRSPTRSTRPYSAYVMASSNEDFPDPVGPLMANTSRASKSISAGSRKAVNPLSSSLSGRMRTWRRSSFLVEVVEDLVECFHEVVGRGFYPVLPPVVGDELVARLEARERLGLVLGFRPFVPELDVHRVRE